MKNANAAATILVVMLLLIGGVIVTYKPFFREEGGIDYGRELSTARNLLDRTAYEAQQTLLGHGFTTPENEKALYCNAPSIPSIETIEEEFQGQFKEEYELIDEEHGVNLTLTLGPLTLDDQNLTMDEFLIAITSEEEQRTIEKSTSYDVSGFYLAYNAVKSWLACDAGNLMNGIASLREEKDCAYAICTCGDENLNYEQFAAQAAEQGAITQEELMSAFTTSIQGLNNLFSGGTCEETGPFDQAYTCAFDQYQGQIMIDDTIGSSYIVNGFQCTEPMNELYGYNNDNDWYDWPIYTQECLNEDNNDLPGMADFIKPESLLPEITQDHPSISPEQATDLFANFFFVNQDISVALPVRCTSSKGLPMIKFWLQVSLKNRCSTDKPEEQGSGLSCVPPGGGGGKCEPDTKCGICGICDAYGACTLPDKDPNRLCTLQEGNPDELCAVRKCDGSSYSGAACTIATYQEQDGIVCDQRMDECYNLICSGGTCSERQNLNPGDYCGTSTCGEKTCDASLHCVVSGAIEDYANTKCNEEAGNDNACIDYYCTATGACGTEPVQKEDGTICGVDPDNDCAQLTCTDGACTADAPEAFAVKTACTPVTGDEACVQYYCDGLECTHEENKQSGSTCGVTRGCRHDTCDGNGNCIINLDDSRCPDDPCQGTCNMDGSCSYTVGASCQVSPDCPSLVGECTASGSCTSDLVCCTAGFATPKACAPGTCCDAIDDCASQEECAAHGGNSN